MKTEVLKLDEYSAKLAAELIASGETVAFPTETVYGLGADVFNEDAVKKIFAAKGRPNDNPLIVHVANKKQIYDVASEISGAAQRLIDKFMPGPITVVLPKRKEIPYSVTAGIDTVGVRLPEHEGARLFIEKCKRPIPAPSANSSGKPSPTCAQHVFDDLNGRIPLILDGGACSGGVESTVISLCGDTPLLLRPGLVTHEMLESVIGKVDIHPAVLENNKVDKAASPGMKYKHYSPKARVLIIDAGISEAVKLYDMLVSAGRRPVIMWNDAELALIGARGGYALMNDFDSSVAAKRLFELLRRSDDEGFDTVLITSVQKGGAGLSVMNRMLRAAAFTVLNGDDIRSMNGERLKNVLQINT